MTQAPLPQRHRGWLLALDLTIAGVLLTFGVTAVAARRDMHRYDADAVAIARWASSQGFTRIAWPDNRREAVPALLAADVTPVLVDATAPAAQQLAVNNTPVLVSTDPAVLRYLSTNELQSGDLTARVIDLDHASRVPIANAQSVGEQIARPYLYAPLRSSRFVTAAQPLTVRVTLEAGHYAFSAAMVDPRGPRGSTTLTVTAGGRKLAATTARLEPAALGPVRVEFDEVDPRPVLVELQVTISGPKGASGWIHEWGIRRDDRPWS